MLGPASPVRPLPFYFVESVALLPGGHSGPGDHDEPEPAGRKDRKRNENDYVVNLKAEIEIRTLHQKIDLLMQEQFKKKLIESQAEQIKLLKQSIIRGNGKRHKAREQIGKNRVNL